MFGPLGAQELVFILILALVIFGPRQLPKIGRTIGRSMAEFRKASAELKRTFNTELIEEEMRESDRLMRQGTTAAPRPPAHEPSVRETITAAGEDGEDGDDATVARGALMLADGTADQAPAADAPDDAPDDASDPPEGAATDAKAADTP